jgi:hypothetical protein
MVAQHITAQVLFGTEGYVDEGYIPKHFMLGHECGLRNGNDPSSSTQNILCASDLVAIGIPSFLRA